MTNTVQTAQELQKDTNIRIENILRKYKEFNITEALSITIKNKSLKQWQHDVSSLCEIKSSETAVLRELFVKVYNMLNEVTAIKSLLLIKYNLSEYNYHYKKDIKIKDLLDNNKKIASTTLQSSADADEDVSDAKEIRVGAALIYELFSLFEQQLNRCLNSIKFLINVDISINKNYNGV